MNKTSEGILYGGTILTELIMLNNKTVLITGGTGSFGKKFIKTILERYSDVKKIIIFSRDELKQFEIKQQYPQKLSHNCVFLLVMFAISNEWCKLAKASM